MSRIETQSLSEISKRKKYDGSYKLESELVCTGLTASYLCLKVSLCEDLDSVIVC